MFNKLITKAFYNTVQATRFTFQEIQDTSSNLNTKIQSAYGPHGLGLAVISDIPNYIAMRS